MNHGTGCNSMRLRPTYRATNEEERAVEMRKAFNWAERTNPAQDFLHGLREIEATIGVRPLRVIGAARLRCGRVPEFDEVVCAVRGQPFRGELDLEIEAVMVLG